MVLMEVSALGKSRFPRSPTGLRRTYDRVSRRSTRQVSSPRMASDRVPMRLSLLRVQIHHKNTHRHIQTVNRMKAYVIENDPVRSGVYAIDFSRKFLCAGCGDEFPSFSFVSDVPVAMKEKHPVVVFAEWESWQFSDKTIGKHCLKCSGKSWWKYMTRGLKVNSKITMYRGIRQGVTSIENWKGTWRFPVDIPEATQYPSVFQFKIEEA